MLSMTGTDIWVLHSHVNCVPSSFCSFNTALCRFYLIFWHDLFGLLHTRTIEMREMLQEWGRNGALTSCRFGSTCKAVGVLCWCWPFLGVWIAYCTLVFKQRLSLDDFCGSLLLCGFNRKHYTSIKSHCKVKQRNWTDCKNVMCCERA